MGAERGAVRAGEEGDRKGGEQREGGGIGEGREGGTRHERGPRRGGEAAAGLELSRVSSQRGAALAAASSASRASSCRCFSIAIWRCRLPMRLSSSSRAASSAAARDVVAPGAPFFFDRSDGFGRLGFAR